MSYVHDTIKVGQCYRPRKVGQLFSADISCHISDFYQPIFRMYITAKLTIPQMTKRWQPLLCSYVWERWREIQKCGCEHRYSGVSWNSLS